VSSPFQSTELKCCALVDLRYFFMWGLPAERERERERESSGGELADLGAWRRMLLHAFGRLVLTASS
jgi:hypothetical protein